MKFGDFVIETYIPTYLPLLSSSTQDSYRGTIAKYLDPRFGRQCLRDLTRLTLQQYFSNMAGGAVSSPDNLQDQGRALFGDSQRRRL